MQRYQSHYRNYHHRHSNMYGHLKDPDYLRNWEGGHMSRRVAWCESSLMHVNVKESGDCCDWLVFLSASLCKIRTLCGSSPVDGTVCTAPKHPCKGLDTPPDTTGTRISLYTRCEHPSDSVQSEGPWTCKLRHWCERGMSCLRSTAHIISGVCSIQNVSAIP